MFLKTGAQEASAGRFLGSVLTLLRPPLPLLPPHTHTHRRHLSSMGNTPWLVFLPLRRCIVSSTDKHTLVFLSECLRRDGDAQRKQQGASGTAASSRIQPHPAAIVYICEGHLWTKIAPKVVKLFKEPELLLIYDLLTSDDEDLLNVLIAVSIDQLIRATVALTWCHRPPWSRCRRGRFRIMSK